MIGILCQSYSELTETLASRRRALKMTQLEADDYLGTQSGYISKLECHDRGLGPMSLQVLMEGFGLEILVVVRNPDERVPERRRHSAGQVTHKRRLG
jgi:hypothetical protein